MKTNFKDKDIIQGHGNFCQNQKLEMWNVHFLQCKECVPVSLVSEATFDLTSFFAPTVKPRSKKKTHTTLCWFNIIDDKNSTQPYLKNRWHLKKTKQPQLNQSAAHKSLKT